jgi:hypothetical protein
LDQIPCLNKDNLSTGAKFLNEIENKGDRRGCIENGRKNKKDRIKQTSSSISFTVGFPFVLF